MNYQRIPGVAALIGFGFAAPVLAQTREEIDQARAAMRTATTALGEGRVLAHREALQQVVALRPDYPTAIYILARAYAREKNLNGALAQLELLARMGLEFGPADDSAFAGLFENKRFRAVSEHERRNTLPLNHAIASDSFNAANFHPDGVTYDAMRQRFCIGSVRLRKVSCRDSNGSLVDFGSKAGLWSVLGVASAPNGHLWLATTALPEMPGFTTEMRGKTALIEIDPAIDSLIARTEPPRDSLEHVFGDIAVTPDGRVYVSDGVGTLYRVENGKLQPIGAPRSWVAPQGITFTPDGKQLFVADYARGVFRVDPATGATTQLHAPPGTTLLGIDGLSYFKGSLIAIQNGIRPYRIVRLQLDAKAERIQSLEVLEASHPLFDEPTTGVVVDGKYYFIANSHWPKFADGKTPEGPVSAPLLMVLPLW